MPTRARLYVLPPKPSLKIIWKRFYHMQFSCQRNSDLIELPRHQVSGREDGGPPVRMSRPCVDNFKKLIKEL